MSWATVYKKNEKTLNTQKKISCVTNVLATTQETFLLDRESYVYTDFNGNGKLMCNLTTMPTWLQWTMISWMLHHESVPMGSIYFSSWFGLKYERQDHCEICNCIWRFKDYSVCLECWLRNLFDGASTEIEKKQLTDNFWFSRLAKIKFEKYEFATTWTEVHAIYAANSVHPIFISSLPNVDDKILLKYTKFDYKFFLPYLLAGYCISNDPTKRLQCKKIENPYAFALRVLYATRNTLENIAPFLFKKISFPTTVLRQACLNFVDSAQISGILAAECLIPTINVDNYQTIIHDTTLHLNGNLPISFDFLVCGNCYPMIYAEINKHLFDCSKKNLENVMFVRCWDTSFWYSIVNSNEMPRPQSIVLCITNQFINILQKLTTVDSDSEWVLIPQCTNEAHELMSCKPSQFDHLYNKAVQKYRDHDCTKIIKMKTVKILIETLNIRLFNVSISNIRVNYRLQGLTTSIQPITKLSPRLDCAIPTIVLSNYQLDDLYQFVYSQGISILPFWDQQCEVFNYQKYMDVVSEVCQNLFVAPQCSSRFLTSKSDRLKRSVDYAIKHPTIVVGPTDLQKINHHDVLFLPKLFLCTTIACLKSSLVESGCYRLCVDYLNSLEHLCTRFSMPVEKPNIFPVKQQCTKPFDTKFVEKHNIELGAEEMFFMKLKNSISYLRLNPRTNIISTSGLPLLNYNTNDTYDTTFGLDPIWGVFNPKLFVETTNSTTDSLYIKKYMVESINKKACIDCDLILKTGINFDQILTNPISLPSFKLSVKSPEDQTPFGIDKPAIKFQNLQVWPELASNLNELLNII